MPKRSLVSGIYPMKVQVRPNSRADAYYKKYGGLPGAGLPRPQAIAPGVNPAPLHDLIFHGGKTVPQMGYKNFFIGGTASWAASDIASIDAALSGAMQDQSLNNMMTQYFPGSKVSCDILGSQILEIPKPKSFGEPDVQSLVKKLFADGSLPGADLSSTIFNFMLPKGSILVLDDSSSLHGLGGYHGSIHVNKPGGGKTTLYYSVGVFSEIMSNGKENGIVVFSKPWKNVVGTFYHELHEFRTDADVDDAIRTSNNDFLGWMSRQGEEIGDQPIFAAGSDLKKVFREVKLTGSKKTSVPVQFLYSNFAHGAEGPLSKPHQ
jgi:hypothetical protein